MNSEERERTRIVSGAGVDLNAIIGFATRIYGPHAYQAQEAFYRWCYDENPDCPDGMGSAVIAIAEDGRVVGMMDKLILTWHMHGALVKIPATGNLALEPGFRKGGLGLRLILRYMKDEQHVLLNGANAMSAPLFRGLKYQELEGGSWCWKALAPVRAGVRHIRYRIAGRASSQVSPIAPGRLGDLQVTEQPDDDLVHSVADFLNDAPRSVRPHWTTATLRWRCFHPIGPRHVLLHALGPGGTPDTAMILSIGTQQGVRIARPVLYRCAGALTFADLLRLVMEWLPSQGVDVLATFTCDHQEGLDMRAAGMRQRGRPPGTFFFHRHRQDAAHFQDVLLQGGSSDMGLEGMA